MREDLSFHATLPRRLTQALAREHGLRRRLGIAVAFALWQAANAVGFFAEAWSPSARRHGADR